jgi:hypothetical protein
MSLEGILPGWAAAWLQKHKRDAADLAALAASLLIVKGLVADVPAYAALSACVVAALVPLRPVVGLFTLWKNLVSALPRIIAATAVTAALLLYLLAQPLTCLWFAAIWPVCAALFYLDYARIGAFFWRLWLRITPVQKEIMRLGFLCASALWLMRGFQRPTLQGGSDALWYGLNLSDALAQLRAGVFPLFVGQSFYQFNGAICPIRVAPAFHYMGLLLDALTFHRLGVFALQNLLLTVIAVVGILSAYLGLRALMPTGKWLAAGLAALFLSCPGVLGIPYNGDLYMTWMTIPLVSIVWFATVRSFLDGGGVGTFLLLGSSLGLSWWGHSPIALWSTLIAAAAQLARIGVEWRSGIKWKPLAAGALSFAAIAAYPIGSVLFYSPGSGTSVDLVQEGTVINIVYANHQVMPEALLPLSSEGRQLSDFQLGYALWAVLFFLIYTQVRSFRPVAAIATITSAVLVVLLIPISGLNSGIWTLVPGFVRDVTGNWAMTRLYLPLAAAAVFGVAAAVASGSIPRGARRFALSGIVVLGCFWSFREASKFADGSTILTKPTDDPVDPLRPENIQISRYSYSLFPDFPKHPSSFTHGVTDPELENRVLSGDMQTELSSNKASAATTGSTVATGHFRWGVDGFFNYATLDPSIRIEAGKTYLLNVDFANPSEIHGVLQIKGPHFFREYGLPTYGGATSFGAGELHSHVIPLWSTSGSEDLTVRYYPSAAIPGKAWPDIGTTQLIAYDKANLPVKMAGWIPFDATVTTGSPGWLETPRMYQPGYEARVDGKPALVRKSPESRVAVQVPAGASKVVLSYRAPAGLKVLFWLSSTAIAAALVLGGARILHLLRAAPPAKASASFSSTSA